MVELNLINKEIQHYCKNDTTCLREILIKHFGFSPKKQEICCCICNPYHIKKDVIVVKQRIKYRSITNVNAEKLSLAVDNLLAEADVQFSNAEPSELFFRTKDRDSYIEKLTKIITEIEYIENIDSIRTFNFDGEDLVEQLYELIEAFTTLL